MYLEHFGLTAQPFRLASDSGFLFMSRAHSRAKAYMDTTVRDHEGFVVITGEIGCGKTTLIQKLVSELGENTAVAKIFQTQLDEVEFLQAVLVEFGLKPFNSKKVELLDMLNGFLIEQYLQRKRVILIVDDAHNLGSKVFEEIRLIWGLETSGEKILHVILAGAPQLNEILARPELEQVMQCVKLSHHLGALDEREHEDYIRHRLGVVATTDRTLFTPEALPLIYKYTGGIPRLINILCDTALTCAYADDLQQVTPEVVDTAASELQWPIYASRRRRPKMTPGAVEDKSRGNYREPSQALAELAERIGRLEEEAPKVESIAKSLAAIEMYLRDMVPNRALEPRGRRRNLGQTADRENVDREIVDNQSVAKKSVAKKNVDKGTVDAVLLKTPRSAD